MKIILKTLKLLITSLMLILIMFYVYYNYTHKLNLEEYQETLYNVKKEVVDVKNNYHKYKQVNDMEKTYFSLYNFIQGATLDEVKNSHVVNRTIYPLSYFDEEAKSTTCKFLLVFEPTESIVCQITHKNDYIGDIYFSKVNGEWRCEDIFFERKNTLTCKNFIALK